MHNTCKINSNSFKIYVDLEKISIGTSSYSGYQLPASRKKKGSSMEVLKKSITLNTGMQMSNDIDKFLSQKICPRKI